MNHNAVPFGNALNFEDHLAEAGSSPAAATLDEMDALWNLVKAAEKTP